MKKVLIVSSCPTHPVTAGNRKGILNQVEALKALGCDVFFFYIHIKPIIGKGDDITTKELEKYWGDHLIVWKMPKLVHIYQMILQRFRIKFNDGYIKVDDMYPNGINSKIYAIQKIHNFDSCIVNYYYLSKLFTKVTFPIEALFTHDYFAYKGILVGSKKVGLNTTAHEEAIALQRSPNIFSVNTDETIYFSKLSPKSKIYNIFSHYDYYSSNIVGNAKLLFFSGNNDYNINGLNWFLSNVFPILKQTIPDVELTIGGSICKSIDIQDERINKLGFFDDPAEFYALGDVVINPTYQGTGLKIKTFEAISYDKVVIAHPHSVEGIYKPEKAPVIVAKEPQEWLDSVIQVIKHQDVIETYKRRNGTYLQEMKKYVESEYKKFLNN